MNVKKIADSILKQSGGFLPPLTSNRGMVVTLRRDDFKNDSTFDYMIELGNFLSELQRKQKEQEESEEPDVGINDYDELELHISHSKLMP
jgi:hypothetical protein